MTTKKRTRVESAKVRQAEHSALSPFEKLKKLDDTLGKGVGAKKEREKLLTQIASKQPQ